MTQDFQVWGLFKISDFANTCRVGSMNFVMEYTTLFWQRHSTEIGMQISKFDLSRPNEKLTFKSNLKSVKTET